MDQSFTVHQRHVQSLANELFMPNRTSQHTWLTAYSGWKTV